MTFSLTHTNVYNCLVLSTMNQLLGEKPNGISPQVVRISQSFRGYGGRDIIFHDQTFKLDWIWKKGNK